MQSWADEIVGRFGRSARFQIGRAGADHADDFSDPHRDQAAVGESSDAKRDIDVLFQKIDRPILQAELNVNLRKRRQELRQNRLQIHTAEGDRGRYTQVPARCRVLARGGALGFGHIGEDSF